MPFIYKNNSTGGGSVDVSGKADKVSGATAGNFAALDQDGNLQDSGKNANDFAAVGEIDALKKSKAEIDDTAINGDTWSSKHIVDMLCPKVEKSGTLVQMDRMLGGYPLGVTVSWTPAQEGSGDPSPENIRPIQGRDSVRVERCGTNLLNPKEYENSPKIIDSLMFVRNDNGSVSVSGTATKTCIYILHFAFPYRVDLKKDSTVKISDNLYITAYGLKNGVSVIRPVDSTNLYIRVQTGTSVDANIFVQLTYAPPEKYEMYVGAESQLTLPSAVCGGEVDAVTGEGQEIWKLVTLDGTEAWETWGVNANNAAVTGFYTYGINDYDVKKKLGKCSHNSQDKPGTWGGGNIGIGFSTTGPKRYFIYNVPTAILSDISNSAAAITSLKAYFAAQLAAGTPVQVAYRLADPKPFTAAGGAAIPALSGTNTVLTDADSVTAAGRADPIQTIAKLSDRIAALEAAATNITE